MATDFYNWDDTKHTKLLFQFDDSEFNVLADVLKEYKQKTGLSIDPYGNSKLHQAHVELMIKLVKTEAAKSTKFQEVKLLQIQKKLEQSTIGLLAIGD